MSNGTPRRWLRDVGWKYGQRDTVEMRCPQCQGRQVDWRETVLIDCENCDGTGWVARSVDPTIIRDGIIGGSLLFVAIVGAITWLS